MHDFKYDHKSKSVYKRAWIFQFHYVQRKTILLQLRGKNDQESIIPRVSFLEILKEKDSQYSSVKETLKIMCVGDNGIGKSSALYALFKKNFPSSVTKIGMGDDGVYSTDILFNDKKVKVQIIDTSASRDEYDDMRLLIYPNMDIIFVFFAVDKPESFMNVIQRWVPEIEKKLKNPVKVLIGTNVDLRPTRFDLISKTDGEELAKSLNFAFYWEISSHMNETLVELFENTLKFAFYSGRRRSFLGNIFNTDLL